MIRRCGLLSGSAAHLGHIRRYERIFVNIAATNTHASSLVAFSDMRCSLRYFGEMLDSR
jgi:hypothetical protein